MSRNATWSNQDSLIVGFGTHSEDDNVGAVTGDSGTIRTYVIELPDAVALEDTDAITVASLPPQSAIIPRGSIIARATFSVTTIFTESSTAKLDIGTYEAGGDGSSTGDDDADGIDADILVGVLDAVGDIVICDGSLVAGVVPLGTVSNSDVVIVFGFDDNAFTAGAGVLTLEVLVPHGAQGVSLAA